MACEAAALQLKKVIGLCHNQIEYKQEDPWQREEALRGPGNNNKKHFLFETTTIRFKCADSRLKG